MSLFAAVEGSTDLLRNVVNGPVQARFEELLREPLQPLIRAQVARVVGQGEAALAASDVDDIAVYLGGGVVATFMHCLDSFTSVDEAVRRVLTVLSVGLAAVGGAADTEVPLNTTVPDRLDVT